MRKFKPGCWEGRRCFVVGGGPSLNQIPLQRFAGEHRVGANLAYLRDVDVNVVLDLRVVLKMRDDPRWNAWRERGGIQIWVPNEEPQPDEPMPRGLHVVDRTQEWTNRLDDGIYCKDNTGLSALHVAWLSGASRIILVGFDCVPPETDDGTAKTENWHNEYPTSWRSNAGHVYANTVKAFREAAKLISGPVQIVNANPASAIDCWPKMPFEQAWEMTR